MQTVLRWLALIVLLQATGLFENSRADELSEWTNDFSAEKDALVATGRNVFFILEPGYQRVIAKLNSRASIPAKNARRSFARMAL